MVNRNIVLKMVDFREMDEDEVNFWSENCFEIIIEVVEGADLIDALKNKKYGEGIEQIFRERDIELSHSGYLIEVFDAKDNFTGDQQVLVEMIKDVVSDTEDELNQLF